MRPQPDGDRAVGEAGRSAPGRHLRVPAGRTQPVAGARQATRFIGGSLKTRATVLRRGVVVGLDGRPDLQDPAFVHHDGAPAERQRLDGIARRVDHDRVALAKDAVQLAAQLLAQLVVEVGERLVEHQEPRLAGQGPGDGDALLLAAGQLGGTPLQERRRAEEVGDLADAGLDLGRSSASRAGAAGRRCSCTPSSTGS